MARTGKRQKNETVKYSLVIPIFNEEAVIPQLLHRIDHLIDQLDGKAEAIFVDDGSSDSSAIFLSNLAKDNNNYRFLKLSRNFGHQIAITAGMDVAVGEAIVIMDADLQDPPEVVLMMVEKWKEGFDVVYARRRKREGETAFKKLTAAAYYRLIDYMSDVKIPRDVGDFRLVSRKVLNVFKSMPERDRFVRGMFCWLGFSQTEVVFDRPERAAGETKYPLMRMLKLALHGLVSFSQKPLRLALWLGLLVSGGAVLLGIFVLGAWLLNDRIVDGWTSTILVVSFFSGINLFMTGIIGLYVGGIHAEIKRRPLYVIDEYIGGKTSLSHSGRVETPASFERRLS